MRSLAASSAVAGLKLSVRCGISITTAWADERLYYPVHVLPYTPARHFPKGKNDPAFRTKLQIASDLAIRAKAAGFAFQGRVSAPRRRRPSLARHGPALAPKSAPALS
jgi:hypothetical protein